MPQKKSPFKDELEEKITPSPKKKKNVKVPAYFEVRYILIFNYHFYLKLKILKLESD